MKIYFVRKANCEACKIALKNIIAVLDELEPTYCELVIVTPSDGVFERFKVDEYPTTIIMTNGTKRIVGSFSKEYFKQQLEL